MSWFSKLKNVFKSSASKLAEAKNRDELEEQLILADFGPYLAAELSVHTGDMQQLETALIDILKPCEQSLPNMNQSPTIVMMIGVNGSGKTTTLAKLTHYYQNKGLNVGLVAGDTFRHGAVEQLSVWADRLKARFFSGTKDAAALVFDSMHQAKNEGLDVLFIDTAGRLQNQANLMEELKKIRRVIQRIDGSAPHHTFLVLDATTGHNAISQVEQFHACVPLTGLIMTKLDGSAKGGMLIQIAQKFRLPIYAIGTGESMSDLEPFEASHFVQAMLGI